MEPAIRENTGRNPDGTWPKGVSGNPSGRPKNTLRAYLQQKISDMTPEQMEAFLAKISPELQWQMAEGRPPQKLEGDKDNPLFVIPNSMYERELARRAGEDSPESQKV